ncbi:molybdopterin-dependent oxidoreductase [Flavobacterium paronense]|uniref:Xanthine dehydrogenase molybdopterin binding subunit n=1 Tax=Flavobacterium paronense TaxID=1392775 RepID=A0ABV5GAV7_9FLAO|nr:molybdopterin cofactor-binding domain-containing protein [Flavobacterium paronense]MDN3675809.1 molybdopterin-dependent oxidoreductase [Flavobacterium paronense]MDN3675816.1 molybdopterin-dependent oxidoreductase [Flavobacterium paronense]MDN3676767.1 molybdopterin-dependent oxidoreductase [Flavobacterium paronense]
MINIDAHNHVKGKSIYLDDIQELNGTLYALPFDSTVAHAKIKSIDFAAALNHKGIVSILTAKDVTGSNQIGGIIPDEPLFAEDEVHFRGQVIALIVGTSEHHCRQAAKLIKVEYEELPVIVDPREAQAQGKLIVPPRQFKLGDTESAWAKCDHIFEGRSDVNGQEHLYIETQGAYARPKEDESIIISSSTQGPTAVQRMVAQVLGIPMHKIEIDTVRLGGGFGGKEDQATPWAVMVALACQILHKPVKMAMHRMDDMRMTGKRHPYSADFKIGLDKNYKIIAYEVTHYQNAGAAADLSPAVMERTLFHSTNAYFVPNVIAKAYSCKTNLPPNTAFRGFGGPQGKFVIEAAIVKAAESLGISPSVIQKTNLVVDGDELSYGQILQQVEATNTWETCMKSYDYEAQKNRVEAFNKTNTRFKKGLAIQPICFGISFTNTMMNHARALVHIYHDGSVVVSTGGVEMGQGLNTKMLQIVTETFSINANKVRIESTNTLRVANTSPTAASAGADLNGKALQMACNNLLERLKAVAQKEYTDQIIEVKDEMVYANEIKTDITWNALITRAFTQRVALSENAHYATPTIHYDKTKEKGHPFAYHVYGTSIHEVTVDCLKGTYDFDSVNIVHDFGKSMNPTIDNGQIEGGLVQGIGWMTLEEIVFNDQGRLLSNALSTYKVPDIYSVPKQINIQHLETEGHELAIKKSKAVGEPPLMYGIGAYFAIRNAVKAFNPNVDLIINAPYTPEKVLMDLYKK